MRWAATLLAFYCRGCGRGGTDGGSMGFIACSLGVREGLRRIAMRWAATLLAFYCRGCGMMRLNCQGGGQSLTGQFALPPPIMAIQLGSIENCHGNYGNWGPIARSIGIQIAIIDRAIMAIGGAWNRGAIEFQLPKLGGAIMAIRYPKLGSNWGGNDLNWGQLGSIMAIAIIANIDRINYGN